jgi:hypothetical protein
MKTRQGSSLCKAAVSTGLCLGIVGFAVYSMVSAGAFFAPEGSPVPLQSAHDPLQNGLRILQSHREGAPRLTRPDHADPAVILLDDWSYTGKGSSSTFN